MENAPAVPSANARVVKIEIRQAAVVRRVLGMFENVTDAANCMNQRSRSIVIPFAAESINVNINYVVCGLDPPLPDMGQNHSPRRNATFVAAKIFQQGKLLGSQLQQVVAPPRLATHQVKLQVG